jgi:hypothetical protein
MDASYARRMCSPRMYSFVMLAVNTQIFSGRWLRVKHQENFLQNGEGFPRYCLQCVMLLWLSFVPSGGDVRPGHSYVCSSVHGNEAWFVTNPALCDQASVGPFHYDRQCVLGGLNVYAGMPHFPTAPAHFPMAIPYDHLSVVSRSLFGPSRQFPCVSQRSFILLPASVIVFCLPSIGAVPWKWPGSVQVQPSQNVAAFACRSPEGIPAAISAASSSRA